MLQTWDLILFPVRLRIWYWLEAIPARMRPDFEATRETKIYPSIQIPSEKLVAGQLQSAGSMLPVQLLRLVPPVTALETRHHRAHAIDPAPLRKSAGSFAIGAFG